MSEQTNASQHERRGNFWGQEAQRERVGQLQRLLAEATFGAANSEPPVEPSIKETLFYILFHLGLSEDALRNELWQSRHSRCESER